MCGVKHDEEVEGAALRVSVRYVPPDGPDTATVAQRYDAHEESARKAARRPPGSPHGVVGDLCCNKTLCCYRAVAAERGRGRPRRAPSGCRQDQAKVCEPNSPKATATSASAVV